MDDINNNTALSGDLDGFTILPPKTKKKSDAKTNVKSSSRSKSTLTKVDSKLKSSKALAEVDSNLGEIQKEVEVVKPILKTQEKKLEIGTQKDLPENSQKPDILAGNKSTDSANSFPRNEQNKPNNDPNKSLRNGKAFEPKFAKQLVNQNQSKQDKTATTMSLTELEEKSLIDLRNVAREIHIDGVDNYRKGELVLKILEQQVKLGGNIFASGFLEIINDGTHGILRSKTMLPGENDVYISSSQIKRLNLKKGDLISGQARPAKEGERYLSLLKVEAINGVDPERAIARATFERLTPIYPNEQIILETSKEVISTRIIDLLSPIGKGQRAMIVAPPKTGKTFLLKEIALGIRKNSPQLHLMIVLIGERPEEVTDLERAIMGAEVMAANFDDSPADQTKVAEMALERAKRLVEMGQDVVILMDSITRLARAYNTVMPASGRTLSGGMDPVALYPSKKFFGAARNFEKGGSLTIIATALVETGSRMDDVVFEEFKGTGNMELKLSRELSNKKIYPAIDVESSGTRNEELLLSKEVLAESWRVRRMLGLLGENQASEMLIQRMRKTKDNNEFLRTLAEG